MFAKCLHVGGVIAIFSVLFCLIHVGRLQHMRTAVWNGARWENCRYLAGILPGSSYTFECDEPLAGRYVLVQKLSPGRPEYLTVCEVEVFEGFPEGLPAPAVAMTAIAACVSSQ